MDFRLGEAGIVEQHFQFFRRIGRHALHYVRPHGIAVNDLHHDGELAALLEYTAYLFQAVRQIGPEIDGLYSRHEVELPVLVRKFLG